MCFLQYCLYSLQKYPVGKIFLYIKFVIQIGTTDFRPSESVRTVQYRIVRVCDRKNYHSGRVPCILFHLCSWLHLFFSHKTGQFAASSISPDAARSRSFRTTNPVARFSSGQGPVARSVAFPWRLVTGQDTSAGNFNRLKYYILPRHIFLLYIYIYMYR
jgi:hypothetical protein